MDDGHRATRIGQVSIGLALLAGLLIAIAACGDDGEPEATPTTTAATPAATQTGLSADTPAPPGVGGEPGTTPAAITSTPAGETATPTDAGATPPATVSAPATLVVGYDMDPSGNSATALGDAGRCVSVSAESEDEFQVDVFLDGLSKDSVLGFGYKINFPDDVVELVDQDHSMLAEAEPESEIVDLTDDLPPVTSTHFVNVADFGPAEYDPPYTQGVLGRYTFKVLPTAAAGTYNLTLTETVIARDSMPDPNYKGYPVGGAVPIAAIWDGAFEPPYGIIAVDVSCDAAAATST